jgi:hypothetical protein
MRNTPTICIAILIGLCTTSGAWAQSCIGAVARVSVPPTPLSFSEVPKSEGKRLIAKVIATVAANHPYHLGASFRGLSLGGKIPVTPKQMTVKINNKLVPVGTNYVEIASGAATTIKGVSVPIVIEIELKNPLAFPAGQYTGALSLYAK